MKLQRAQVQPAKEDNCLKHFAGAGGNGGSSCGHAMKLLYFIFPFCVP